MIYTNTSNKNEYLSLNQSASQSGAGSSSSASSSAKTESNSSVSRTGNAFTLLPGESVTSIVTVNIVTNGYEERTGTGTVTYFLYKYNS